MATLFNDLLKITDPRIAGEVRKVAVREFAERLRWTPSYDFTGSYEADVIADHVILEHGLENSAVISFLKAPNRTVDLEPSQIRSLLSISYNNLVEWHVFVSQTDLRPINNLAERAVTAPEAIYSISASDFETRLSPEGLSEIFRALPVYRKLAPCDDALIQVISRWKRLLKAEVPTASNANLSSLFNAIIFVRGCEDRHGQRLRGLLNTVASGSNATANLRDALLGSLAESGVQGDLGSFVDIERLSPFDQLFLMRRLMLF